MISRAHRFHGHNSLHYVYQHGKTVRGPMITLKYIYNAKRREYRLAVVVSKKISKSAVQRNRIRRRLYEAVRLREKSINGPYDIIITVFNERLGTMPAADLQRMVHTQLQQAKLLEATTTAAHDKI